MSNLHVDLDELNKHDPKGFIPAVNNTFPVKDELGNSFYEERMSLPKAINFVDGTVAAPTTVDGDIYVLTGSGVVDSSWGGAAFGDWVRFLNTFATPITPLDGYLCFDVTAATWMQYDGSVWAVFGGGGGGANLYTADGTLTAARTVTMAGFGLNFEGGQTTLKGAGTTSGTTALLVQNNSGSEAFKVDDARNVTNYGASPLTMGGGGSVAQVTFKTPNTATNRGAFAVINGGDNPLFLVGTSGIAIGTTYSSGVALKVRCLTAASISVDSPIDIIDKSSVQSLVQFTDTTKGGTITQVGYYGLSTGQRPSAGWFGIKGSTVNGAAMEIKSGVDPTGVALISGIIWNVGGVIKTRGGFEVQAGQTTLKGAGTTSGTTALLVQNSSGTDLLEVQDDGTIIGNFGILFETSGVTGGTLRTGSGTISGNYTTLLGGQGHIVSDHYATIAGGQNGKATGENSFVGGGLNMEANGDYSVASGGRQNDANFHYSAILGGYLNVVNATYSCIVGGEGNTTNESWAFTGGGTSNANGGFKGVIGGGHDNEIDNNYTAVLAGLRNRAMSLYSVSVAGVDNDATNEGAVNVGGNNNNVSGSYAGNLGGRDNVITHTKSFVVGSGITSDAANTTFVENLKVVSGSTRLGSLPVYADEAAAIVGGLATDTIYKTVTGELRIKL